MIRPGRVYFRAKQDGSYIITAKYPEDDWVYGTILSYGEYIEVLEPAHIREIMKTKLCKVSKNTLRRKWRILLS
ncbi:MAG: WYL domain-containing protein [Clostridiales bacterium]|jgi:predicted DNA-binding transcriptional regulator YafY|nr:WYL domain-containing protein [Clostridiales bacterium]